MLSAIILCLFCFDADRLESQLLIEYEKIIQEYSDFPNYLAVTSDNSSAINRLIEKYTEKEKRLLEIENKLEFLKKIKEH